MITQNYQPSRSYLRVATACPEVAVGNVEENISAITHSWKLATEQAAALVVFPELSLCGYTLGDLVMHERILSESRQGLVTLAHLTQHADTALVVGLPFVVNNTLYNCAAVLSGGQIRGIVPKTFLPSYKEFYEKRWFQPYVGDTITIDVGGQKVPFGTQLLFQIGHGLVGIEICEDLWTLRPPSENLAAAGAVIIANPSASPEQTAKSGYRRQLVAMQSARLRSAYIYAGCDASESTTDIVMGGHQMIAENGHILAERKPLSLDNRLSCADIDIDHLRYDRRLDTNFPNETMQVIDCQVTARQANLARAVIPSPFLSSPAQADSVLGEILAIQAQALATRLKNSQIKKVVLGLSGGLDSTLALLVAVRAAELLHVPASELLHTLTMPGQASSHRTQNNATKLANVLGIPNQLIPIAKLCQTQLTALDHDGTSQDVTYENVQARTRTSLLFNRANQLHALVLGTGDLSEIALGWSTFNGDHMSHYNVNASIPKTLVASLVTYAAKRPEFAEARSLLEDIVATPISPELTRQRLGRISQETEKLIGPYQLHDFFLYYFVRFGDSPEKIFYLARQAFKGAYTPQELGHWLSVFIERFMGNQWKRSVMPDGPKVGSVSLSPRGDWRAPSDITAQAWQNKLQ